MKVTEKGSGAIDILGKKIDSSKKFEMHIPLGAFLCGNQDRECTGKPAYLSLDASIDVSDLNFSVPVTTMFCEAQNRKSQPMRIRAIDKTSLRPVAGATLLYGCGAEECLIGVTDSSGELKDNFPLCENGQLRALKDGYSRSFETISTEKGADEKDIGYKIEKLKEFGVQVRLVELPEFMKLYQLSDGFAQPACGGVATIDDAVRGDSSAFDIIITGSGPSQPVVSFPTSSRMMLASGTYGFNIFVKGDARIESPTVQGQTFSLSNLQFWMYGNYGISTEFTSNNINAARTIVFYAPVDTVSKDINPLEVPHIIQEDGSLFYQAAIDTDCNPSTPEANVDIAVPREKAQALFQPRLI